MVIGYEWITEAEGRNRADPVFFLLFFGELRFCEGQAVENGDDLFAEDFVFEEVAGGSGNGRTSSALPE